MYDEQQIKALNDQADGVPYFLSYWNAYEGNENEPLSPFDGARLYFINAFAHVWESKGHKGDKIPSEKIIDVWNRVNVYKDDEPELFEHGSPTTTPLFQNAMAADFCLSAINDSITTNYNIYRTALLGLLSFASAANMATEGAKKTAKLDFARNGETILELCKNAVKAHKIVTAGMAIIFATGDVLGVPTRCIYATAEQCEDALIGLNETLANISICLNTTRGSSKLFDDVANYLNMVNHDFNFRKELYEKIKNDIIADKFNFTRYLGAAYVYELLDKYNDEILDEYENRDGGETWQEFKERTEGVLNDEND